MEATYSTSAFFYAQAKHATKENDMNALFNNLVSNIRDDADLLYRAKYASESKFHLCGIPQVDQYRNGVLISGGYPEPPNTFTTEGMAYLLNRIFSDDSKAASYIWYVGMYDQNVTPAVGNTAAVHLGAAGTYGACQATTDFDESAYQVYTGAETATATITNSASKAEYTVATTYTVYGVFLGTASDPTDTTGTLMCAKKLTTARSVVDGDEIAITYAITIANA